MPKFVHLHTHSHYSLLDGLAKINDLVARTKELGMDALALTDHGNLYGAIEFYKAAKKAGIKPILGVEAYMAPHGHLNKRAGVDEKRYHLVLLAKNNTGWRNIIQLVTKSNLEGFYYKPRIDKELLEEHHEGIICLSGCAGGEIPKLLAEKKFDEAKMTARWYQNLFHDDFYLELQPHSPELHSPLLKLSHELGIPVVATQDIHYAKPDDQPVHEILLAVQTSSKLDDEDRLTMKKYDLSLRPAEEMIELFKEIPQAIENTVRIADECGVELELGKTLLPKFEPPDGTESSFEYLKKLINERISARYPVITPEIEARLAMELSVIEKTGFADYFLIVQDYIIWAKDHGIAVGPGRGSAAGSIIAYILRITNIDPIKYDLLFERFLNPDRIEVPDIDVDFTDIRRDEVVAYVREKYGSDRVAQIITFGTMAARAAIRDAGRALGLSYGFCDEIAKLIPFNPTQGMKTGWLDASLQAIPELKALYDKTPDAKRLIDAAKKLEGVARHASVHACGVVISAKPLTNYMGLQRAPQGEDSIVTQSEAHAVSDLGVLKMDFLGLKNLTIIEKTLRIIDELHGIKIDIDALPLDDQKTFELFRAGDTTGVFQLESSGMRHYLKELTPTELEDIIAMISLYRPGPMELIPSYIKRKHGKEEVTYIHPSLEPILKKTYGVGVYQEQMMRIARDLAGFTLAEADTLRKAIGKKIKELLEEQRAKLISGMVKNGISEKTAKEIWELFPPFARYGFNRSHAACYAMISYQTAYLKAHYPVEFTASLLNVSGTDIDRINFLVSEAKHLNIKVLPPDVNLSAPDFAVDGPNIRFGLMAIKNVGANIVQHIIEERNNNGPYSDFTNFINRIQHKDLNKKSLENLAKAGAFDSLGVTRGDILANIEEILAFNQSAKRTKAANQHSLFGADAHVSKLRIKPAAPVDKNTILKWEKELLGLYITGHPFAPFIPLLQGKIKTIKEILTLPEVKSDRRGGPRIWVAGTITTIEKITTKKGTPMLFVTIEDHTEKIELLVFEEAMKKTPAAWEDGKCIAASGRVSFKNDEQKFICDDVKILAVPKN